MDGKRRCCNRPGCNTTILLKAKKEMKGESGGEGARLDVVADELDGSVKERAGAEDGGDAFGLEEGDVLLGDGAADDDEDVLRAALVEKLGDAGDDGVVCAGENAETDAVDIFLNGGVDDHFRGLAEAGVDDFHTCVAEGACDDLCATVVAVEAGLGNENADWGGSGFRRHGEHVRLPQRVSGLADGSGEKHGLVTTIGFTMTRMPVGEEWVGRIVDQRFPLMQWLGGTAECGVFFTERPGGSGEKAVIKVMPAAAADAEDRAAGWEAARELEHPYLLKVYAWGRGEMGRVEFAYVVTEYAPEALTEIVPERVLTAEETRSTLEPLTEALEYLHGKGLVHGHVKPANIMADGDVLKLTADHLLRAGTGSGELFAGEYDAPEMALGVVTPAADVWSVGVTLAEVLTRLRPAKQENGEMELPLGIPEPFEGIVRACLRVDPKERCGLEEIRTRLSGTWVEASAEARTPTAAEAGRPVVTYHIVDRVEPRRPARRGRWWLGAVGALVVVIAIAAFLLWPRAVGKRTASENADASESVGGATQPAAAPATATSAPALPARPPAPVPGLVVRRVPPEVLRSALETIYGTVRVDVRVKVGTGGRVIDGEFALHGPSRYFAKAAMAAAMQWVFRPPQVDGRAVRSVWLLKFGFTKDGSEVTATQVSP